MKLKIKRFDKSLPIPKYQSPGAVAFDFYLRYNEEIKPGEEKTLAAGIAIEIPKDYMVWINSRGSTAKKFGLFVIPGIVDSDYIGDEDQYYIQVVNFTKKVVKLEKGTRIDQGILLKVARAEFEEVEKLSKSRGGFGTTGHK